jgi:heat shock protein HtpX
MARQRVEFERDTGLQARMLFTLFLLGLLYVALVGVLFASGASGVLIAVIAGGLLIGQFFLSDKLGLAAMGAKVVTPDQAPGLHAMIERLCIQADLPKPKIAVADTTMPNAFAIGRSQKAATVCATTGLMNMLEPHELEAVMAHELTHVKNRDVLIMTVASFFAALASMIVQFGFFFGGGSMDDGDDDNPSWAIVLLVSFVVYILSFFLMLALSRYREFVADRGSALITGRPSALSSALLKITSGIERVPQQDLRAAEGMSAFFIVSPALKSSLKTLFMDHPPTEKRIEQLSRLEAQLQLSGPRAA